MRVTLGGEVKLMPDTRSAGDLMRAYYRALDTPDLDALDDLLSPDCDWQFPGTRLRGPGPVKQSMAVSLAADLTMDHAIGHLIEDRDVAICELTATNTVAGAVYIVPGAVVCEARGGRIVRMAAYPDANAMQTFLAALRERGRQKRAGG
jgi:ketosteroid isomerase-like protein